MSLITSLSGQYQLYQPFLSTPINILRCPLAFHNLYPHFNVFYPKTTIMRIFLFVLLLLCITRTETFSQNYHTVKTTSEKALEAFKEGRLYMQRQEAAIALGYFEKALKNDDSFIEARLALAETYEELRDFFKAERAYEEALALDSTFSPVAFFFLAKVEWQLDKFEECAAHLNSYLQSSPKNARNKSIAEKLIINARFAAEAVKNPVPFQLRNTGPGINTKADEYFPSLTADGGTLIFTRNEGYDENFYSSSLKDTLWQTAIPLDGVNTPDNEGAQSISPDGSWLVFTACNRRDDGSQGSCDLYWSQLKNDAWTKPVPFSAAINSSEWDSQPTISADSKTIIFSSRRPGGKGKEDIWITIRQAGGKWSKPQNLGPGINTAGVEQTPFLHPDGQSLYFASDSLPGMGGMDLYVVRRSSDSTWGVPLNLGYPINTKANEVALTVSLDGRTAYYATNRSGGQGGLDIYSFELPEIARPQPVTYVRAHVRDAVTGLPLVAKIELSDLGTGRSFLSANTKPDGSFLACLPAGKSYGLNVNKEKYLFHSENFNLTGSATVDKPFLLEIDLQPITLDTNGHVAGKPIVLRNVFFETGSAELRPESTAELDRLLDLLVNNASLRIQINGHTDNVGTDASNQQLSEARAKAVYDYLCTKGLAASRLKYKGYGEAQPLDSNDTTEGRTSNRRTEFIVW